MNKITKSAVVYPMDREYIALFRYQKLIDKYETLIPISPNGYGFTNKDVGIIDKGTILGTIISSDFEEAINQVQDVIFTRYSSEIINKMVYAVHNNNNIVCLFALDKEEENIIYAECLKYNVTFTNFASEETIDKEKSYATEAIKEIKTPVLVVCGLSEKTQKFDIQLFVRELLEKEGYKISQIGSRTYSKLFNMYNFPSYMLEKNDEQDKIHYFNKFVKEIELKETPDLIIIGVPGGVMPYDKDHANGFGVLNYLVSNAVNVDYTMLSLAYNDYDEGFFQYLNEFMKYRYDYSKIKFHLSNVFHDIYGDKRIEGERIIYVGDSSIVKKMKTLNNQDIFNVNHGDKKHTVVKDMIDYLAD